MLHTVGRGGGYGRAPAPLGEVGQGGRVRRDAHPIHERPVRLPVGSGARRSPEGSCASWGYGQLGSDGRSAAECSSGTGRPASPLSLLYYIYIYLWSQHQSGFMHGLWVHRCRMHVMILPRILPRVNLMRGFRAADR